MCEIAETDVFGFYIEGLYFSKDMLRYGSSLNICYDVLEARRSLNKLSILVVLTTGLLFLLSKLMPPILKLDLASNLSKTCLFIVPLSS